MATAKAARMPFGKFKNTPIEKIDPSYLEWVLANCQQISPDLKRAICTRLGLEVQDDPKDREIEALQQSIQELRHKVLVSRLEAYDEGYQDGKNENLVKKVKEWHQSLSHDYQGSTEAMTVVNVAYDRLRKALEFKNAPIDHEQQCMTLEDYCLERDVSLDHRQLIKEGLAITRHLRTAGLPAPNKVPHERFGTVNRYKRCTLDRWYQKFMARAEENTATRFSQCVGDRQQPLEYKNGTGGFR
jgi:hypothetical protein